MSLNVLAMIFLIPTVLAIMFWVFQLGMYKALKWSWGDIIIAFFSLWILGEIVWVITLKLMVFS